MIWVQHSSCKYISPLAISKAIWTLWLHSGLNIPNSKFAKDPLLMNSYTRCSLCGPSSQNPINLTKFL
ncbi:unnamed protein product, partial [Vitis vinifera]